VLTSFILSLETRGKITVHWLNELEAYSKIPRGKIHIIKERCKGCQFCIEFCPKKVLKLSDTFNQRGYHFPEIVDERSCVCYKLCEHICPEFAIYVEELTDETKSKEKEKGFVQQNTSQQIKTEMEA
jgi:2-oxoglutarate ferredoxin oxidoreductase subunit delta